ncbi:MAG: transketolase C-terminal domain-containing protein, partial [Chloroflexota bacterium]|nr:transketolase C-terminal domain-containing protein [Chloroflexota bacterium]
DFYQFHSGSVDQEVYDKSITELTDGLNKYINSNKINYSFRLSIKESVNNKKSANSSQNLISAYSRALINQASLNEKIVALDGDLILDTGLIEFEKKFPNRFFECGIAEQDMVSQAGSFAKEGYMPFVHSFSSFLTSRPNEQIYNNSTEKTKVVYVGSLAGLLPGGPGHSHQAVRDIASMSGIPNLEMIQPLNEIETELAVKYAVNSTNNIYIRLCSLPINLPFKYPNKDSIKRGEGTVISDGEEIVIFCYSPLIFTELWKAKELLGKYNINPKLISFPWLNKFSSSWIKNQIKGFKYVVTIDDHYIEGGFGEKFISNAIKNIDTSSINISSIGVGEIPHSGTNEEVIDYHGLSSGKLKQKIINLIKS